MATGIGLTIGILVVNKVNLDKILYARTPDTYWNYIGSISNENYPIVLDPFNAVTVDNVHSLRQKHDRVFKDNCRLQKFKMNFNIDAARLWNAAPLSVKMSTTNYEAKKAITAYVKTLPI